MCSGLKDELVPPEHMRKLVEAAKQVRFKQVHNVDHGSHNVSPISHTLSTMDTNFKQIPSVPY